MGKASARKRARRDAARKAAASVATAPIRGAGRRHLASAAPVVAGRAPVAVTVPVAAAAPPAAAVPVAAAIPVAPAAAPAAATRANLSKVLDRLSLEAFNEGRWAEAAAGYERLLVLEPRSATFRNNAGAALRELRQLDRAFAHLAAARDLCPDSADVHYNLGSTLLELGRREAEAVLRRAIELDPKHVAAHVSLALAYERQGEPARAADAARDALALDPAQGEAHGNLASALREQGDLPGGLAHFRRAMELCPRSPAIRSGYLLARHGDAGADPEALLADHREWERRFAAPLDPGPQGSFNVGLDPSATDPERRLRVGYVSPHFRRHAVASFVEPILAAHDRAAVEVICYSDAVPDAVTDRIRAAAGGWRDVRSLDDAALAAQIAADEIDVVVDLAGHTAGNRLLALARRPAPVQVTYCGYPGTTGLAAIGWRLTDAVADPRGPADGHHVERLWRLPRGFLCFRPDPEAPPPAPPPAEAAGAPPTFGWFGGLARLGPDVLALWAELLRAVPGARLLLEARALADSGPRDRVRAAFAAAGVDPDRIRIAAPAADTRSRLELYRAVDVALDPFPCNGTTTTCEALWMGVPVVALAGRRHAGRVGASLLDRVGFPDLAAATPAAYLKTAAALAADRARRALLRRELRDRMRASPLTSASAIARDIEDAYRAMWRCWCSGAASASASAAAAPAAAAAG